MSELIPGAPTPPPGWYAVPGGQRWWDGRQWGPLAPALAPAPAPAPVVVVRAAKESGIAYLLWFFLGGLGVHHFYLRQTGQAVAMLVLNLVGWALAPVFIGFLLLVPVWIWLILDLFLIPGYVRAANSRPLY